MKFNVTIRVGQLNLIQAALDAAATPGEVLFYTGTRPPIEGSSTTAILQGTVVLAKPCAIVSVGIVTIGDIDYPQAVMTFVGDVEGVRVAADIITWARFVDGDGNFVCDANVRINAYVSTGPGDEPDLQIDNPNGYIGGLLHINSIIIRR